MSLRNSQDLGVLAKKASLSPGVVRSKGSGSGAEQLRGSAGRRNHEEREDEIEELMLYSESEGSSPIR